MKRLNYRFLLMFVLLLFSILIISCKEKEHKVKPIEASHMIYDEKINSYMRILSRPTYKDDQLVAEYSFTFFSHFLKLDGITGRYYNYYQVDWLTDTNVLDYSYHIFDYLDGAERNYSQNFHPYCKLNGNYLTNIKVQIDYEYNYQVADQPVLKEETITYNEDIMTLELSELNDISFDSQTDIKVKMTEGKSSEKDCTRYYLSYEFDEKMSGHLDLQTWVVIDDKVIPLYGMYHYQFNNGNYDTYAEGIDILNEFQIDTIYCQIKTYTENGDETSYFLQLLVDNEF